MSDELERLLERYEDAGDAPQGEDRDRLGRLLGEIDNDAFEDLRERAAAVLDCSEDAVERHRTREQYRRGFDTDEQVNIRPEDGEMWHIGGVPLRRQGRYPILNFELDANAILDIPDEDFIMDLEMRFQGDSIKRSHTMSIFHDRREFFDKMLIRPGMLFKPGERSARDVLDDLSYYIFALDAPHLQGTKHIGLHGSEFVTPDGSLTPDGWTDDPQTVYVHQGVGFERQVALPTDRADYDSEDVATILRHLPDTRPTSRLLPVIGWFYAAPFRPHIFDMEGQFNLLNITGDTGSGKTTTLRYLWRCFGMKKEPFSVDDTPFAHTRTMAATNAIPTWYDEYKPGDIAGWKVSAFHGLIRKAATGGIEQRGNRDKTTDEYHLKAPVVISGEQQIQPPAERRRSIMVSFRANTTGEGTGYREAYKRLAGEARMDDGEIVIPDDCPDPEDHALAYYRYVTGLDAETVRERWNDARRRVAEYRARWADAVNLDDMEVQGLQTILFGWATYLDFAERHGVATAELPGDDALGDALRHVIGEVGPGGRRLSHLERFIELVARSASRGALEEGQEYALVNEGTESEELRFHLDRTFDGVSKYVRDHGLDGEDLFNEARDYRKRIRERYEDEDDALVRDKSIPTDPPGGRCVGISTRVAEDELNFARSSFGAKPVDGDTRLASLDGDYCSVVAEVAKLDTDLPDGAPEASGTLRDESGLADLTCWSPLDDFETRIVEGGTYRFKHARVGEYEGAPQVMIDPNYTSIEAVEDDGTESSTDTSEA